MISIDNWTILVDNRIILVDNRTILVDSRKILIITGILYKLKSVKWILEPFWVLKEFLDET